MAKVIRRGSNFGIKDKPTSKKPKVKIVGQGSRIKNEANEDLGIVLSEFKLLVQQATEKDNVIVEELDGTQYLTRLNCIKSFINIDRITIIKDGQCFEFVATW